MHLKLFVDLKKGKLQKNSNEKPGRKPTKEIKTNIQKPTQEKQQSLRGNQRKTKRHMGRPK